MAVKSDQFHAGEVDPCLNFVVEGDRVIFCLAVHIHRDVLPERNNELAASDKVPGLP